MNKKFFIAIIFILFLIIGGVFWWWQIQETPPEEWEKAKYSKPEDYVVKETPEGKIIENKKTGLSFRIPEGWRMEKSTFGRSGLALYSQDAVEERTVLMKSGCRITFETIYVNVSIETLQEVKQNLSVFPAEKYEIIKVGNYEGLKGVISDLELNLYGIDVSVPVRDFLGRGKLDSFILVTNFDDKERCIQEFENFLETISIK